MAQLINLNDNWTGFYTGWRNVILINVVLTRVKLDVSNCIKQLFSRNQNFHYWYHNKSKKKYIKQMMSLINDTRVTTTFNIKYRSCQIKKKKNPSVNDWMIEFKFVFVIFILIPFFLIFSHFQICLIKTWKMWKNIKSYSISNHQHITTFAYISVFSRI